MNDEDIVIGVRGDVAGGRAIKQTLDQIATSGTQATTATKRLETEMRGLNSAATSLQNSLRGIVGAFGIREVIRMADNYTLLKERVKLATNSTEEFNQAFRELQRVSNETGAKLNDAVDVFQRLSFVRSELKATVDDMVLFTGTVQKLGVMSGASTTAMSAGLLQLGQAMSAGVVRAEEFNSVIENLPAVAKAVADQFGVTTGALRMLVLDGVVASEDFYNAVLNASAEVEAAYARMPVTIGRAFNALYADMEAFIGQSSKASGAAMGVIGVIDLFRVSIFGLGQAFNLIVSNVGTTFNFVINAIEAVVNRAIENINGFINVVNRLPGVDIGNIEARDWNGGLTTKEIIGAGAEDARSILSTKGPKTIFDKALGAQEASTASTEVRKLTQDYKALAAGLSDNNEAKKAGKKIQTEITAAVKASMTEEQKLNAEIKRLGELKAFAVSSEQVAGLEAGIRKANGALEELRIKAEMDGPIGKAFKSLADEIDDGFKDAFKSAFTETDGGWKKLLEGWKATFKSFLADLAYQALARPIVLSVIGGIGGSMGLSSSAIASVLGGGGGGGLGLGSIASGASNLSSLFGGGGGVSSFVNSIGSSLGFYNPIPAAGMMGPVAPSGLFGATTFSQFGAGSGIGSLAANLFGLGNKNPLISGGAGLAGAALGQVLIPVPILGAAVGSFLGTAVSGLFGGGTPRQTLSAGYGLDSAGMLTFKGANTKGGDQSAAEKMGQDVMKALNSFAQTLGGKFLASPGFETNVGEKDPGTWLGGSKVSGTPGDANAIVRAFLSNPKFFSAGNAQLQSVLTKSFSMGSSADQALADVNLAKQIYGLDGSNTAASLAEALAAINKQFDEMKNRAIALGLPTERLNELLDKQRDAAIGSIKAMQAGFDSLEQMQATFDAFLKGQQLGPNSGLSPMAKLGLVQKDYGDLLGKAQGGDLSVTPQLLAAANDLLAMGRSVYASSASFAGLESFVRSGITGIARAAGVPGYAGGTNSAASGMAWVGERGPELIRFRGGEQVYTAGESKQMAQAMGRDSAQVVNLLSELVFISKSQHQRLAMLEKQQRNFAAFAKVAK